VGDPEAREAALGVPAGRFAVSSRVATPAREPRADTRADQRLPNTLQFLQLLWTFNQALELASKRMALALGVTGPQRLVIRLIGRFPGLSAGELATTMRTDPSTLTGVLQRLEAGRLIRRARDARDARRVLLSLTARGRSVDRLNSGTIENAVKVALRGVPERDIACTARVLRQIASTIMESGGGNGTSGKRQRHETTAARSSARRVTPATPRASPPGVRAIRRVIARP
jgi:DNA-binding MarR family transcriptional regulator